MSRLGASYKIALRIVNDPVARAIMLARVNLSFDRLTRLASPASTHR